jgi:hypothetical protein
LILLTKKLEFKTLLPNKNKKIKIRLEKEYSNPKSVSITGSQAKRLGINVQRLCLACENRGRASGSALPGSAW